MQGLAEGGTCWDHPPSTSLRSAPPPQGEDLDVTQVLEGIKVLEVAQFVFVPAAGAVLAEWGADVIKVEHPLRGDAQRGMRSIAGVTFDPVANPMIQHPNKGKRSIGIDIATAEGQQLIYELAKDADVFLTNYLPCRPPEAENRPGTYPRSQSPTSSMRAAAALATRGRTATAAASMPLPSTSTAASPMR